MIEAPTPEKQSNRTLWIALSSVAAVVVIGVVVLFAVTQVTKSPADKASAAVQRALMSYFGGDCETATKQIDGPSADILSDCKMEEASGMGAQNVEVTKVRVTGKSAELQVKVTTDSGHVRRLDVPAHETADGWKAYWN